MLTENDVVAKVAAFLESNGYRIESQLSTSQQGTDIIARSTKTGLRILIEAKGATSSKRGTNRFGRPFTRNQSKAHLGVALLTALRLRQNLPAGDRVALAFPETAPNPDLLAEIGSSLHLLELGIFWVGENGSVRMEASWVLGG